MNKLHRLSLIGSISLVLSGCALLPQPDVEPPTTAAPPLRIEIPVGSTRYEVDRAELVIHTFRAGWLQGQAHNHVMTTDRLSGDIYLADPLESSAAIVSFRPWDLILDDPAARAAAGPGFESERSAADIEATRTRMLGPRGFHTNDFPFVLAEVRWHDEDHAAVHIALRGDRFVFVVPLQWTIEGERIEVDADFELSHRALGLTPYSAFAGAIAVADRIRVQLSLSASLSGPV
jgi:hypothetical protein